MRSNDRETITTVFDALDRAADAALDLSFDALTAPERLALLERCERLRRRLPAVEHPLVNALGGADPAELGGKLAWALADRLRITRAQARRRIDEAADLGERHSLTGEPLEPMLPAAAAAQRCGDLGPAQVQVIRGFFAHLPETVDVETAALAEKQLATLGCTHRPDELAKLADRLTDCLNPDGDFSDTDRARKRSLLIGKQHSDGMSPISGWLTPEARAMIDAVLARWAAPGMCNPDDDTPCLSGTPPQEAIDADRRSAGQRNHDALTAMVRNLLESGELGQHNGLPATVVVSLSLAELEAGAGKAHTGGGSWLPIRDFIALAGAAHHYLRIYDGAKEIALFHRKRIANAGQRLVLYAKERGCSHPGCTVAAQLTEVHHVTDYATTGRTDIDDLTLRCGPHHRIITVGGWTTRRGARGVVETIPPGHLDRGQPRVNHFHHPEDLLCQTGSEP